MLKFLYTFTANFSLAAIHFFFFRQFPSHFFSFLIVFPPTLYTNVYHIYPTPPLGQDMTQGQFFKRSITCLDSEFSSP